MNALIIVDMQNDFVEGGALAVKDGLDLVPVINGLQKEEAYGGYDLIVATQDWHPANHGSFAINHPGKNPGDLIELNDLPQVLWPVHCVQNTPGADFVPGLDRSRWAAVFPKGTDPEIDSYSGFFDNGKRRATGMGDFLKERGVDDVSIVGLATDYCVKFTALDAVTLGFPTKLIANASCGVDLQPGDTKRAVEEMQRAGVQLYFAMNHGWQGQAGDEWLTKMGIK